MRLTKKKALQITQELWEWIAETDGNKGDWLGWERYGHMDARCPLCEYARRHGRTCQVCPLYGKWAGETYCTDSGSPYDAWCRADHAMREKAAAQVANLCKEALANL